MKILVQTVLGCFLGFLHVADSFGAELAVGDDAPAFELVGTDGNTYRLADFRDQRAVVIAWYPKAATSG